MKQLTSYLEVVLETQSLKFLGNLLSYIFSSDSSITPRSHGPSFKE